MAGTGSDHPIGFLFLDKFAVVIPVAGPDQIRVLIDGLCKADAMERLEALCTGKPTHFQLWN